MHSKSQDLKKTMCVWLLASVAAILLLFVIFRLGIPALKKSSVAPVALPPGSLKARLEIEGREPFYIGDLIPVNLIIEGAPGTEYSMPQLDADKLGGLELAEAKAVKKEKFSGGWRHIVPYRLVGWQAGEHIISGLTIRYQDRAGKKGTHRVDPLLVKVASLLPANLSEAEILADGPKGPKKPAGLPPDYHYLWFILAGLGLAGFVSLLVKRWKGRSKAVARSVEEELIIEPGHLIALRRLDELQQRRYLERGEYKPFYDQLSEIAREYMENRFRIRALEMTTEEFLMNLAAVDFLDPAQKAALGEFLQYSDLVKFAKHQPLREEGEQALAIIRGLVEATKEPAATAETAAIEN